ncbi:rho GTPase-activating protein conundrum [Drosophila biarmipes]|uniref:rho GTPase-activating protein conundrum n=1 Tax=Drosophila biarmipes TaxID=125945 RepID=UPI001CDB15C1|nr:rho GTPase-activating protein conundrum [Drosophila biarmipes]XP_043949726.1 rho GTPase-activating protein conundrum [Drosophila biarmipes]XP_043949727.1 rho GTPase-activating protein conundrum [Drosophila biarmipes]
MNNNSMHNSSDQEYSEFLKEYLLQASSESVDPENNYEDGEMEAEWLTAIGYPELSKPFKQGLEVCNAELEPILTTLSQPHAEAIAQRVRTLNQTVRCRTKTRPKRKPDIRDVFRDLDESSTGTRSRSATPDSLDSIQVDEVWANSSIPSFENNFEYINKTNSNSGEEEKGKYLRKSLHRTPSAPIKTNNYADIFRGSQVRRDIPLYSTHGVELLGYSRIGTIHLPRNRSSSDPFCSVGQARKILFEDSQSENKTSSSQELPNSEHQSIRISPKPYDGLSFESICRDTSGLDCHEIPDGHNTSINLFTEIFLLSQLDLKRLQAVLWLELATIFDRYNVRLDKRKMFKRRRKEEGNLFGVSLNALIRRDQQVTGTDSTLVPQFLEKLLAELLHRGSKEEGILRIGGHKQKIEILYKELESTFYQKPEKLAHLFGTATVHELGALLKRWLRELPQPLLTTELIQLFYQCHRLPSMDQQNALTILCQLLPPENRNTLRFLLSFLNNIIDLKDINKMDLHNVSTIIAPSFFPPRFIHPTDRTSIAEQLKMAAHCCRLTKVLILHGYKLFRVPNTLLIESNTKKMRMGKKGWLR